MNRRLKATGLAATALLTLVTPPTLPAQPIDEVRIETIRLTDAVSVLVGRGGNIAVCTGPDGVFMIDDQFAPLTERIVAAVAELSGEPIRFVINTHWHGDHTGGNENLGAAGAIVVAHENVRERMSTTQFMTAFDRTVPPSPEGALPVITFTDGLTFHLNDDTIEIFHVADAHTDGDVIIRFVDNNVVHMGDTFFTGMYPFIDVSSGGSVDGVIEAADRVLALADEETRIIPGHGQPGGAAELRDYRNMLRTVRDRVQPMVDAGRTSEQVIAAKPTRDFDATWGTGFIKPDRFVAIVYDAMKNR